ncbi:MAG TPA: hypothetical protein VGM81_04595 [Burkholderiaceae bacterium]|jgi:hypothetical protein
MLGPLMAQMDTTVVNVSRSTIRLAREEPRQGLRAGPPAFQT